MKKKNFVFIYRLRFQNKIKYSYGNPFRTKRLDWFQMINSVTEVQKQNLKRTWFFSKPVTELFNKMLNAVESAWTKAQSRKMNLQGFYFDGFLLWDFQIKMIECLEALRKQKVRMKDVTRKGPTWRDGNISADQERSAGLEPSARTLVFEGLFWVFTEEFRSKWRKELRIRLGDLLISSRPLIQSS